MCVHPASSSLEGGASPGEEEAEECCEMRPWPHTSLVGDDECFTAAQREISREVRIWGLPETGRQTRKRPEDLTAGAEDAPQQADVPADQELGCLLRAGYSSEHLEPLTTAAGKTERNLICIRPPAPPWAG